MVYTVYFVHFLSIILYTNIYIGRDEKCYYYQGTRLCAQLNPQNNLLNAYIAMNNKYNQQKRRKNNNYFGARYAYSNYYDDEYDEYDYDDYNNYGDYDDYDYMIEALQDYYDWNKYQKHYMQQYANYMENYHQNIYPNQQYMISPNRNNMKQFNAYKIDENYYHDDDDSYDSFDSFYYDDDSDSYDTVSGIDANGNIEQKEVEKFVESHEKKALESAEKKVGEELQEDLTKDYTEELENNTVKKKENEDEAGGTPSDLGSQNAPNNEGGVNEGGVNEEADTPQMMGIDVEAENEGQNVVQ